MSLESTSARAERLARDIAVHGRHIPLETVMAEIEAIDEAAVEAALSRILEATPSVAAVGPMKDASALQQVRQSLVRAA